MAHSSTPWINTQVKIIKGNWKGYEGIVKDVRRHMSLSGVQLLVELSVWTPVQACPQITVDYDDVREPSHWQPLAVFAPLSDRQIYFAPNKDYRPMEYHVPYIPIFSMNMPSVRAPTPLPPDSELEDLPSNAWWDPRPHSIERLEHWILDPRLNGLTIEVSVSVESGQRNSAWVTISDGQIYQANKPKTLYRAESIGFPIIPPLAKTEKGLLVVVHGEHIGALVRQIHYFNLDRKPWFIAGIVINGGRKKKSP
ncbi:hypothetical protein K435DRAFT_905727 [Dendrothele bispora CBS 962.96]|uniref:Spt5 KOW domain-containing protein n=1 Tax=Dendrothele bispora (strain CBS 962.96) TaxID=1314807 RepID=A0A4S8LTK5_DENBC|nr:hypothetical protein K435DRAFT_905727 [Dendrothele bispora CBS 962.96]